MNRATILKYMGQRGKEPDHAVERLVDEAVKIVEEASQFRAVYKPLKVARDPFRFVEPEIPIPSRDLAFYFEEVTDTLVIACTLGPEIDRLIRFYEKTDMAMALAVDAAASTYLEEACDAFQEKLELGVHSFRFCPGYGDLPLSLNRPLAKALNAGVRIGARLTDGDVFFPTKTMLGIIGLGINPRKSCMSCIRKKSCELLKEGLTCYVRN